MSSKVELPLIALVNSKSGGQDGPKLIKKLLEHISKENVFDLAEGGPATGLATCKNQRTKVLVCGGDGTVAWVLSEIKKLNFEDKIRPVVAILPLGTANDLSRTLKWGPGWAGEKLHPLISQLDKASVVHMDQWHVTSTLNSDAQERLYVMNNYFSVGSDAEVALKFHKKREKKPTLFKNRTLNKGFYAKYAVGTFLRAQPLATSLDVELDGVKLDIPSNISVLLVLNTPSYASGMNPWGPASKKKKAFTHQAIDDGRFEVVGIKGLLHAGGLQMRMVKGKRLGQGTALTIKTNRAMAAQVDGEPWLLESSVVTITHGGHALMLANSPPNVPTAGSVEVQASSASVSPTLLEDAEPLSYTHKPPVLRTMSSTSVSNINYGPTPVAKRKKNRYYCDICNFEFFLPYMLDNHKVQGCKTDVASSPGVTSPVYTQPTSLSYAASAPATLDSPNHEVATSDHPSKSIISVGVSQDSRRTAELQEEHTSATEVLIDQTSLGCGNTILTLTSPKESALSVKVDINAAFALEDATPKIELVPDEAALSSKEEENVESNYICSSSPGYPLKATNTIGPSVCSNQGLEEIDDELVVVLTDTTDVVEQPKIVTTTSCNDLVKGVPADLQDSKFCDEGSEEDDDIIPSEPERHVTKLTIETEPKKEIEVWPLFQQRMRV